jgi:hypothetical protein
MDPLPQKARFAEKEKRKEKRPAVADHEENNY